MHRNFHTAGFRRHLTSIVHQLREQPGSHLDLNEIDVSLFVAPRSSLWVPPGGRAVFGGQVLGQALHAASRTVTGALGPHSMRHFTPVSLHSYFLQRGEPSSDIVYRVRKTADLRSFASRTVEAIQRGETIFTMQTQFARTPQHGLSHANAIPSDVLPPEQAGGGVVRACKRTGGCITRHLDGDPELGAISLGAKPHPTLPPNPTRSAPRCTSN